MRFLSTERSATAQAERDLAGEGGTRGQPGLPDRTVGVAHRLDTEVSLAVGNIDDQMTKCLRRGQDEPGACVAAG